MTFPRRDFLAFVLAAAVAGAAGLPALAREDRARLLPFDDGPKDPSFAAFRERLLAALKARDLEFLRRHLDRGAKIGLGHDAGPETFLRVMREETARWDIFARILGQGGGFMTYDIDGRPVRHFQAPYTAVARLGPRWDDPFTTGIVTGEQVRVRAGPTILSAVVGRLSYHVVEVEDWRPDPERPDWVRIRTPGGRTGYIHGDYITGQADWRATFHKEKGRWLIDNFLAGD